MRRRTTHEAADALAESEQHFRHAFASAAQRLDALGRLAGEIAHDFNNMLTVIEGYSELLLHDLEPGSPLRHEAEQIRRAAQQASSLPGQLLAFSRKPQLVPSETGTPHLAVLVVEDEEIVRELAVDSLERAGFRVLAAAGGAEAISLVDRLEETIDVLVTDLVMPGMSGSECAARILDRRPETAVVLMSGYTDAERVGLDEDDGAAYLQKPFSAAALVDAVTAAAGAARDRPARPSGLPDSETLVGALMPLTRREREVLALLAEGMTNDRAAAALGISSETVQSHVRNAMAKLDAGTRTQAVASAIRRSLIP